MPSNATPWLIVAATLISALVVWLAAPTFEGWFVLSKSRGRNRLVLLMLFAGGASAWLSVRYPQRAWIIFLAALLLALLLGLILHKLGTTLKPTTITWSQYLKGQGLLLFFFLFVGSGAAWLSVRYGPYPARISKGVQLKKFELDPSKSPANEEVDVENYNQVSIFTRTSKPDNGSAVVTIYLDHGDAGKLEMSSLDTEPEAWSRWDQAIAGKKMSLVATAPTRNGAISATEVDVLVFLSKK